MCSKNYIRVDQGSCARASHQERRYPVSMPPSLLQLPAAMQGEQGGGEGSSPPGNNDLPGIPTISFARKVDFHIATQSDMFSSRGGRPKSVGGADDPSDPEDEEYMGSYNPYAGPEDSAEDK